ncbi:MAG: hypothetical protein ACUVXA_00210 [Candidatus Jordarchaeum sp.]|uniref:hypothetical protein n=1 Tax=Candidatus Jordarchaeum sp. TaxID=2823881 RepID=UPI00404AF621
MLGEEFLNWIIGALLFDGIILVIGFFMVFLGLKVAISLVGAEESKMLPLIPSKLQLSEKANPYVQIAEALEEGDQGALLWLISQTTPRSKIIKALNSVAVDLFLGTASLLSVLSVYIEIRALPVQDWILIIMIIAAIILVAISYWRVKD